LSAADATGEEKVFFPRVAGLGVGPDSDGRLGVFSERTGIDVRSRVEVDGCVLSEGCVLAGDLNGVLNGERKGLESVLDAASIRRRFAAGVDILA
jgi:hypothetical protein